MRAMGQDGRYWGEGVGGAFASKRGVPDGPVFHVERSEPLLQFLLQFKADPPPGRVALFERLLDLRASSIVLVVTNISRTQLFFDFLGKSFWVGSSEIQSRLRVGPDIVWIEGFQ